MQDPLSAMHIFVRVAELRSFTQAALVLGLSKTHVSNRVAQLEQWAGARLLQRTTRSVTLTEAGQRLRWPGLDVDATDRLARGRNDSTRDR